MPSNGDVIHIISVISHLSVSMYHYTGYDDLRIHFFYFHFWILLLYLRAKIIFFVSLIFYNILNLEPNLYLGVFLLGHLYG